MITYTWVLWLQTTMGLTNWQAYCQWLHNHCIENNETNTDCERYLIDMLILKEMNQC